VPATDLFWPPAPRRVRLETLVTEREAVYTRLEHMLALVEHPRFYWAWMGVRATAVRGVSGRLLTDRRVCLPRQDQYMAKQRARLLNDIEVYSVRPAPRRP
jgi:hypothetical protein